MEIIVQSKVACFYGS